MMPKYLLLSISVFILLGFIILYRKGLLDISKIYRLLVTKNEVPLEQKPWFRNHYCGVMVETPYELQLVDTKVPAEHRENVRSLRNYTAEEGEYLIVLLCLETTFTTYDVQEGLRATIQNLVAARGGTEVKLEFQKDDNQSNDITCAGTASISNTLTEIQGYTYWDGAGKIIALIALGENKDSSQVVLSKIIKGIKVDS